MKKILSILALTLILGAAAFAGERQWCKRTYASSTGLKLPYNVLFPENFDASKTYPVLLFLHGSGERGCDNEAQLTHGGELLRTSADTKGMIVIAPQCPEDSLWAYCSEWHDFPYDAPITAPAQAAMEIIYAFTRLGFVDTDRIYCSGLSMGGMGTLDLALRFPDFFAAVEPICGQANFDRVRDYKGRTAFRFFHGADDPVVTPDGSKVAYNILKGNKIETALKMYKGVKHGSWNNAFKEKDYISWLLKHDRKEADEREAVTGEGRIWDKKVYASSIDLDIPYRILYPENFDPSAQYPILLFLHGSGEKGTNNEAQLTHGGEYLRKSADTKGLIVIAPQCPHGPRGGSWTKYIDHEFPYDGPIAEPTQAVMELVWDWIRLGFVDTDRIYGSGLSMGGIGIMDLALRFPDFFTAVEPICARSNYQKVQMYRGSTAFRFFHGTLDKNVPYVWSRVTDKIFRDNHIESELVTYEGVGHGSWNNAFKEPDYITWLLKHTKASK